MLLTTCAEVENDIRKNLVKINDSRKQLRLEAWKEWASQAMSGLWRKATEQVSAISDGQESLRQSPELVARDALEAWGSVWRAQHVHRGQEDRVPQDALDDIPLSPITLLHVRLALSSSSRGGKGVDGWTNRAMKSLRNASLAIVIRLLGQFEALWRLPLGSNVCLKCYWRTVLCRSRWRGGTSKSLRNGQRGAEDTSWMAHFEVEETLAAVSCAEVSLDSEKCHERIHLDVSEIRMKEADFTRTSGRTGAGTMHSSEGDDG